MFSTKTERPLTVCHQRLAFKHLHHRVHITQSTITNRHQNTQPPKHPQQIVNRRRSKKKKKKSKETHLEKSQPALPKIHRTTMPPPIKTQTHHCTAASRLTLLTHPGSQTRHQLQKLLLLLPKTQNHHRAATTHTRPLYH